MGWPAKAYRFLILIMAVGLVFLIFQERALASGTPPASHSNQIAGYDRAQTDSGPTGRDMLPPAPHDPAIRLTVYQKNWVQDKSRFKIGVITRQGGKSFGTSLEAVLDCYERKTKWVFLSAGERQSKELMATAAMHARAVGLAVQEIEGEFHAEDKDRTVYKQLEIVFPNGSRIIGLPANPDTARGHSAHILLDEFAFHKDSRAIWKALFPTVTRGYKIRIISTFKGKSNKFYELFYSAPTLQRYNGPDYSHVGDRGGWSKHFISIHQAVQMGLELKDDEGAPCEPEDLRLALNDNDAWEEEFECIPSDEASAFLSHDLISTVEDVRLNPSPSWVDALIAAARINYDELKRTRVRPDLPLYTLASVDFLGDLYLGFDIGRKKDLSVLWLDQKINGILRTVAVIELRRQPFFVQEQVLHTLLSLKNLRRACIDETGIGAQLAEGAQDLYGTHKVEPVTFTIGNKESLATALKQNFEDRASQIPADAKIRDSLHSVKRYATTTGHFRFDAERTDDTGHADHFWAKALAVQAGTTARTTVAEALRGRFSGLAARLGRRVA
jgi:phage FluMu gp28-like protein